MFMVHVFYYIHIALDLHNIIFYLGCVPELGNIEYELKEVTEWSELGTFRNMFLTVFGEIIPLRREDVQKCSNIG